jgi:hypothetical protein
MWLRLDVLRYRVRTPSYRKQLEVEVGYDFLADDEQTVLDGAGEYELVMLLGADDGDTTKWKLTFVHDPLDSHPGLSAATDDELRSLIRDVRLTQVKA